MRKLSLAGERGKVAGVMGVALGSFSGILWESYRSLRAVRGGQEEIASVKQRWALRTLEHANVSVRVLGMPMQGGPVVMVGNHVSYLDIPLLVSSVPTVGFVAKEELKRWPLFGEGMRRTGTVFVKRESAASRAHAMDTLRENVRQRGAPIAIFPSGTTCMSEAAAWKSGAFRLAAGAEVPLQAFRLSYSPMRTAAFIGDDAFLPHLWRLCQEGMLEATIEFAGPELVTDPYAARDKWRAWCTSDLNPARRI